ncbi:lipopolysaccharide biosynthesis protein [Bacillus sp. KH172YL63]|uniref:lipopolysaccharide biosynthesis protein n=1 Tax=Bacillus sp. KH172YL63 TaxID=2709784 RepID=UPI0013E4DA93|nr:oligosaccharide flippase family protein [Bacillus sp. KH172YL63]BCB05863.1 hypothetical protein KH172YL63_39960 [Bacillus sp. KH172YL63]
MKDYTKYLKRFLGILSSSILNSVFNFLLFTLLSIISSERFFGEFSFAYAMIFLFIPFVELGVSTFLLSNNYAEYENSILSLVNLMLSLCVFLGVLLFSSNIEFALIFINVAAASLYQIVYSMLIKNKMIKHQLIFSILNGTIKLIIVLLVAITDTNLNMILIILIISNVLPTLFYLKKVNYKYTISKEVINKRFWFDIKWISLSTLIAVLLMRLDQIIIGHFLNKNLLGWYMISIQWFMIISIISTSLLKYSFSEVQTLSPHKIYEWLRKNEKKIDALLISFFLIFIIVLLVAIKFIYSQEKLLTMTILILSFGFYFSIKYNFYSIITYKEKNTKVLFIIQILQLFIQLIIIMVFFKYVGYYSFPIAFSFIRLFGYLYLKHNIKKKYKLYFVTKAIQIRQKG